MCTLNSLRDVCFSQAIQLLYCSIYLPTPSVGNVPLLSKGISKMELSHPSFSRAPLSLSYCYDLNLQCAHQDEEAGKHHWLGNVT